MIKRIFDITVAAAGLVVLSPVLVMAGLFIKTESRGPIFFRQERMGRGFRPFFIYKFRTMISERSGEGEPLTVRGDPRVTRLGKILRKTKLDEVPQLINVLRGDMTFVGPRPEVRRFVELFKDDYEEILKIRPGITDLASLKYRDEESVLAQWEDPQEAYVKYVLPDKIRLAKEYLRRSSVIFDIQLIFKTLLKIVGFGDRSPRWEVNR